ncbi:putative histamine N-methyltransferase A [Apostichopus japonicus]|uniref:Putative histamine N-methyltransferase A n=1 Tax=Stichopus japonicus TaxID=307972 RepID=A0A2G8K3I6_STIJA|nr:putative histamine N-methyltransferase A [Apostichopus japonicus]
MDLQIISTLLTTFPKIQSSVVEPVPEHIAIYKDNVKMANYSSIRWDWHQMTWQEYYGTGALKTKKFHFITAIHVMYYFEDLEATVHQLLDSLVDGGILFMIIRAERPQDLEFVDRFAVLGTNIFSEYNAATITKMLQRLHIKYDSIRVRSSVDITACFDKNDQEGQLLLDFIMQTIGFQDAFPAEIVKDVLQCFRSSQFSEKVEEKVLLRNDWEAIIVSK